MNKLSVRDVILAGVLHGLMLIICMTIAMIMSLIGPVTNVFYPAVTAIPNGIVMMLLLAKVPKRGVFFIGGVVQGLLFLVSGAFWTIPVSLIIGGIICDVFFMSREKITLKTMTAAYALFSGIFAAGAIAPINFFQAAYVAVCVKNGLSQDYIDGLIRMTSLPMLALIIGSCVLTAILGALLGQKMLKKHFVKAGLVTGVR